jgi:hypothetical protein
METLVKKSAKKATTVVIVPTVEKTVKISLTQVNKNGQQNASFIFGAKGENLNDFLVNTCKKIVGVMQLQSRIKENGGKSNAFGLTKSGEFELSITTISDTDTVKELNNFVFTLGQLGTQKPELVLVDMVEGYKLLTE